MHDAVEEAGVRRFEGRRRFADPPYGTARLRLASMAFTINAGFGGHVAVECEQLLIETTCSRRIRRCYA